MDSSSVRVTECGCNWWGGVVSSNAMLLCVDVGDVRGGFALRRFGVTSLLAVPDEVLEVLYSRHD